MEGNNQGLLVVVRETNQQNAPLIREVRNYIANNNIKHIYLLRIIERSEDLGVFNPEAEEILVEKAEKDLEKFLKNLGELNCSIDNIVKIGSYHDRIEETVKEYNPEAIIVQSSKLKGIKKILLGSLTTEIINNAHCPVIVVGS